MVSDIDLNNKVLTARGLANLDEEQYMEQLKWNEDRVDVRAHTTASSAQTAQPKFANIASSELHCYSLQTLIGELDLAQRRERGVTALLLPQLSVKDLNEVSFQALRDRGFKGVVFDKDNTLTVPHDHEIAPHLQKSFDECKRVFGDRVLIFSNSAGSSDDAGFKKAAQIEAELQCAVLRHNQKKPDGIEHVTAYFGAEAQELVMIGDRYSTDVLFGNLHGLLTIRTDQFAHEGESAVNALMQKIESRLIERLVRAGVVAPSHPLVVDTAAFAAEVVVHQKCAS